MILPFAKLKTRPITLIVASAAAAGAILIAACNSTNNARPAGREASNAPAPGPSSGFTPIGPGQNSLGITDSVLAPEATPGSPRDFAGYIKSENETNGNGPPTGFELGAYSRTSPDWEGELSRKLGREYAEKPAMIEKQRSIRLPRVEEIARDQLAAMYRTSHPRVANAKHGVHFSSNEEIWVIQRYVPQANDTQDQMNPGTGSMGCYQGETLVPVPLKHTDVRANITGFISTVDVEQTFTNPYPSKIEAVYAFPLPENAAVSEFVMTIGDRHIRGIIRDKAEAQQIYAQARSQGKVASILNQERPNLFVQKVANIEPGREIDISIRYYNTLSYSDGAYEFVFPMVIAPRYNPSHTDGIGAVARGNAGTSGEKTEISYLRPNERSGTDISLKVEVDAGVSIEKLESPTHAVKIERDGSTRATVELSRNDSIPNKDFILRCHVAGSQMKSTLLTTTDSKGDNVFALMLIPPRDLKSLQRAPLEMVYVLDASGSMDGKPMTQAKDAIARSLKKLNADDTFQLINFSNTSSQLGNRPIAATRDNVQRALAYLDQIAAAGGTEMMNGLRASLNFPHDPHRMRYITFLTDGLIGNEADIIREIHSNLGDTRIFSFGVSAAPNRYLLDAMARVGSGGVAYLAPDDSATEVMDAFDDRISHPALFDVKLDFGSADVSDVFPQRIPDLCVDRPVIVTGKYRGHLSGPIRISGRAGGMRMSTEVSSVIGAERAQAKALPQIWANMKIQSLAEKALWNGSEELAPQARATALRYAIMSPFTSFVAVDSLSKTQETYGTTVQVPVAVPDGTRYETTVGEK